MDAQAVTNLQQIERGARRRTEDTMQGNESLVLMSFYAFCAAAVVASSGIARRVGSRIAAAARAVGDAVVGSAVVPVAVVAAIAIVPIAGAVSALRPIRVAEAASYPRLLDLATDHDRQTTCRTPMSDIPCVRLPEVEVIVTTATAEN